jgi:hypothetical protein
MSQNISIQVEKNITFRGSAANEVSAQAKEVREEKTQRCRRSNDAVDSTVGWLKERRLHLQDIET